MRSSAAQQRFLWICFIGILILSALASTVTSREELTFVPILVLPFAVSLNTLRRRVDISKEGITSYSPWSFRSVFIPWWNVQSVTFSDRGPTIRVQSRDGVRLAVPCVLSGTRQMEDRMKFHLPVEVTGSAWSQYEAFLREFR
jgi:hypothetical protein